MKLNKRIIFSILLAIVISSSATFWAASQLMAQQRVTGTVRIVGSPALIANPTSLNYGNMTANTWKIETFNLTNTGNVQLNLTYAAQLSNRVGGMSILWGSNAGLPVIIPVGTSYIYDVNLTISPNPLIGLWGFNITITGIPS